MYKGEILYDIFKPYAHPIPTTPIQVSSTVKKEFG